MLTDRFFSNVQWLLVKVLPTDSGRKYRGNDCLPSKVVLFANVDLYI